MNYLDIPVVTRVARGMDRLDAHRPDWWQTIDLDTLDQSDPQACVVGQTFADLNDGFTPFTDGLTHMGVVGREAMECGFAGGSDFDDLTREFRARIQDRRIALLRERLTGDGFTITPAGPVEPAAPSFSDEDLIRAAREGGVVDVLLLVMGRPESDRFLVLSAVDA